MAGSIGVLLVAGTLFAVLFQFKLRPGVPPQERRTVLLFIGVIILLLIVNTLLSWQAYRGIRCLRDTTVIRYAAELGDVSGDCPLVIEGVVSSENEPVRDTYIACNEDGMLFYPSHLIVDLQEGKIELSNRDFRAVAWPCDIQERSYLPAGHRVILVAEPLTRDEGISRQRVRAVNVSVIFAGSRDAFVRRAEVRSLIAGGLTLLTIATIAVILLLSTITLIIRRHRP